MADFDERPYIEIKNITKVIKKNIILDNINMKIYKGRICGIKGKNGSGKTMLFRAICGFIKTDGMIEINGKAIGKNGTYAEDVGVLLEYPGFIPNYTGFKNLKYLAQINNKIDDEQIKKALIEVGLDPDEKKVFKKYSLGMKQKLGIAQSIMENPQIIILDEPTNALDEDSVKKIYDMLNRLKAENKVVIISNHNKEELEAVCDEIYTIENGKIINHTSLMGENVNEK
ncbi:MAG: ATP-binding cassette domain-containing protein [Clostridiaceae bacterium]